MPHVFCYVWVPNSLFYIYSCPASANFLNNIYGTSAFTGPEALLECAMATGFSCLRNQGRDFFIRFGKCASPRRLWATRCSRRIFPVRLEDTVCGNHTGFTSWARLSPHGKDYYYRDSSFQLSTYIQKRSLLARTPASHLRHQSFCTSRSSAAGNHMQNQFIELNISSL